MEQDCKRISIDDFASSDMLSAFRRAADFLRSHPGTTLFVPPGTYILRDPQAVKLQKAVMYGDMGGNPQNNLFTPEMSYQIGVDLSNCCDITIDAYGANLYFDGFLEPFLLYNTNNVCLRGFNIDYIRKPYSKGRILSCDATSFTVDFGALSWINPAMPSLRAVVTNCDYQWKHSIVSLPTETNLKDTGKGKIIFTDLICPVTVGDDFYVSHSFHFRPAIHIYEAENTLIEGISIFSHHGMGIVGFRSNNIKLNSIWIIPALGEAVSTNTDATHFASCSGTIVIENSHFAGHGDDASNVHSYYHTLVAKQDENYTLEMRAPTGTHSQKPDIFDKGDLIEVVEPDSLAVIGNFTVRQSHSIDCLQSKVSFDLPIPEEYIGKLLIDTNKLPKFIFRNNVVHDHLARSLLIKTRGVCIENNSFARSTGTAIQIASEAKWSEGANSHDVIIRRNKISSCGNQELNQSGMWKNTGGIAVCLDSEDSHTTVHKNICIEGNIIDCPNAAHAIYAGNSDGITVCNNLLRSANDTIIWTDNTNEQESNNYSYNMPPEDFIF